MTADKHNDGHTATAIYESDAVRVSVSADEPSVLEYLDLFYRRARMGRPHAWIRAQLGNAPAGLNVDTFGVGYSVNGTGGQWDMEIYCDRLDALQIATRKAVRERRFAWLEARSYAMFHASAVYRDVDATLLVFVGEAGAGKTTLALDAVLRHGFSFVSNDHLIVYGGGESGSLTLTSLHTPIPVRVETFLALEHLLPEPWDASAVDLDACRTLPDEQIHSLDAHVHYLLSSFGNPDPVEVTCGAATDVRVHVIFPAFAAAGQSMITPFPAADIDASAVELAQHLRVAWAYGAENNGWHLPTPRRSAAQFIEDGQRLARQLCACGSALIWQHHGVLDPLLSHLDLARIAA